MISQTIQKHAEGDRSLTKAFIAVESMVDKKAENIKLLNLEGHSSFTDYFIICSAMSDRQIQTIADTVEKNLKEFGTRALHIEGYTEGRWVLMDFGDIVVHIFLDAIRDYYALEELWKEAPQVKIPNDFFAPAASQMQ